MDAFLSFRAVRRRADPNPDGWRDRQFPQESSHGFRLDPADTTLHTTQAPRSGCRQV